MSVIVLDHVPGALAALQAVQYVGGVLLPPSAAEQLVVAALYAAHAETQAAAYADAADILSEYAEAFDAPGYTEAARLLDSMSALMRSEVHR